MAGGLGAEKKEGNDESKICYSVSWPRNLDTMGTQRKEAGNKQPWLVSVTARCEAMLTCCQINRSPLSISRVPVRYIIRYLGVTYEITDKSFVS